MSALLAVAAVMVVSCDKAPVLSDAEKDLVSSSGPVMRVLTVNSPEDVVVLRTPSGDFARKDIASDTYADLASKMVSTVTDPSQDGVGIAGPQVGILRRVVAVQRLDKPGEPFEVYPNIRITACHGECESGSEGCLSVPDMSGEVMRWRDIDISYVSPATLKDTTESVHGFTAVIFQHECDHLDGVLYIDKLQKSE